MISGLLGNMTWKSVLQGSILVGFCVLIASDEMITSFILVNLRENGFVLFLCLFLIQLIGAPLQAGLSDAWCRKRTLMLSITASSICCSLLTFFITNGSSSYLPLYIAACLKFSLGNMLPICRAGIVDFYFAKGFRFIIGVSTISIAEGYFSFQTTSFVSDVMIVLTILLLIILTFFAIVLQDKADDQVGQSVKYKNRTICQKIGLEIDEISRNFIRNKKFMIIIFSYMFWELSFYSVFLLSIDMDYFPHVTSKIMIAGYILGVLCLWFLSRRKDVPIIKCGMLVASLSVILLGLNASLFFNNSSYYQIRLSLLGCFSFGYGLIIPCMFAMLTKDYHDLHSQGKLYGLIESGDGIAFVVAFFLAKIFANFRSSDAFIFVISLSAFVVGVILISRMRGLKIWKSY